MYDNLITTDTSSIPAIELILNRQIIPSCYDRQSGSAWRDDRLFILALVPSWRLLLRSIE
ncbi:hypothetical protein [Chamaesiphon sp.]|uniref:hypothetical protein n=1 Tax=Chamaesiphon sp. TaxID=2814140 RepID=UPI0035931317